MFANLRSFALFMLVLAAVAAMLLFAVGRMAEVPEDCLAADAAMTEGDHDLAIDRYILCIDSNELPDAVMADVFYNMGNAYSAKQNPYQAIRDYGTAIELNPNHGWAYNNRCYGYGLLRRPEEALRDCETAMALLPDQPAILDSRALAYWLLDETEKARRDLERAHQLDPSFPTWQERLREFEGMY